MFFRCSLVLLWMLIDSCGFYCVCLRFSLNLHWLPLMLLRMSLILLWTYCFGFGFQWFCVGSQCFRKSQERVCWKVQTFEQFCYAPSQIHWTFRKTENIARTKWCTLCEFRASKPRTTKLLLYIHWFCTPRMLEKWFCAQRGARNRIPHGVRKKRMAPQGTLLQTSVPRH